MPWRFQVNKVKWIGSLAIKVCAPFVFSLFFLFLPRLSTDGGVALVLVLMLVKHKRHQSKSIYSPFQPEAYQFSSASIFAREIKNAAAFFRFILRWSPLYGV